MSLDVADLYRRKESKRKRNTTSTTTCKVFIRTADGPGNLVSQAVVKKGDHDFGTFMGNVGSMRRSRKGRTYHAPNGQRFYVGTPETVVAYKV